MNKFTQLRPWLAHLANTNRLLATKKNVPLKHELAAIAKKLDGKSGVFFPNPDGHAIPVVSGFISLWLSHYPDKQVADFDKEMPKFLRTVEPIEKCPNDHKTMVKHKTKVCNICGIDL